MRPLDGNFLIILSRGRAPPGGFKFEVKVNGVIYGPPDVVSLYKIRTWVSFIPPPHTEKEENKFGTFSIFGPAAEVRVMQVLRSMQVMQQGWA